MTDRDKFMADAFQEWDHHREFIEGAEWAYDRMNRYISTLENAICTAVEGDCDDIHELAKIIEEAQDD